MMVSVAAMFHTARYVPYAWIFVVVIIALIVLLFMRVYGPGDRSRGRTAHRKRANRR